MYTNRAEEVLDLAPEIGRSLGAHDLPGGHIFLVLTGQDASIARAPFEKWGIEVGNPHDAIEWEMTRAGGDDALNGRRPIDTVLRVALHEVRPGKNVSTVPK